jgi:hypothetical protein
MTLKKNQHTSIRIDTQNPNHHLYDNNGTWWIHYTVYPSLVTTQRFRQSLKTKDVVLARQRRDALFVDLFANGKDFK